MKLNDIKQSRFMSKNDLGEKGAVLVTIKSVEMQNVAPKEAKADMKPCITFVEDIKPLVCNSTNFGTIVDFSGKDDSDNWSGTKIVVYFEPNIFFSGKKVGGLRVRAPKTGVKPAVVTPVVPKAPVPTEEDLGDGGADAEDMF